MDWATIIGLLTAVGAGSVLVKLVEGIIAHLRGRHGKEQTAWEQRDAEARLRRRTEEVLHETRQLLHKTTGMPYADMPTPPSRETKN